MRSLPPLNSLRAFESAARHLSFSKAASELNVTPGAVSQQIKLLEDFLSINLFHRKNRQILLTQSGQLLLPKLNEGFDLIAKAVHSIQSKDEDTPLTITAPPAFISKWLIPKLSSFNQQHPSIDVRIDSSKRLIDFDNEDVDVGIRFSQEKDTSLDSTHLLSFNIIAVCSPELLKQGHGLHNPSDLNHYTLLNYNGGNKENSWPDWEMWLSAMQINNIDQSHSIVFNQTEMMLQAAIEGQGVALSSTIFAENDIQAGRLVQPFKLSMPISFSYYLVTSTQKSKLKKVNTFKKWIIEQASREKAYSQPI